MQLLYNDEVQPLNGFFLLLLPVSGLSEALSAVLEAAAPEGSSAARAFADQLQDRFGVTILTGEDPDPAGTLPPAEGPDALSDLEKIEEALSAYREGFFSILKNRTHPNGLRILLTDRTAGQGPPLQCVRTAGPDTEWHDIRLENGNFSTPDVHHAIWHALEKAIQAKFPYAFTDWTLMNPPGFVYPYDYSADTDEFDENYFARGYGTISQEEDRATLFEATFRSDYAEWVADKTGIKYKLYYINTFISLLAEEQ